MIIYTKHAALDKFAYLKRHEFKVSKRTINIIASKSIDAKHILRVVYRKEDDKIIVTTFYPAEKGRYY